MDQPVSCCDLLHTTERTSGRHLHVLRDHTGVETGPKRDNHYLRGVVVVVLMSVGRAVAGLDEWLHEKELSLCQIQTAIPLDPPC